MIEYPVRGLCFWLTGLTSLIEKFKNLTISYSTVKLSALPANLNIWSVKNEIKTTVESLEELLKQCSLDASLDRVKRVNISLQRDPTVSILHNELLTLSETIMDELVRRTFLFVSTSKAEFFTSPENRFPKSWNSFPSAQHDITEACRCYATGHNTASVFHCMGIVQGGLHALANDLNVAFPFPIVLAEWKNVIDQIESEIRKLEQLKRGQIKDEKIKFYSTVAVQFRYFKDAWRNHVAHFREQYDEHQALSILNHTRDFIEYLSEEIAESPFPSGTP
jgi:hypothetical protein